MKRVKNKNIALRRYAAQVVIPICAIVLLLWSCGKSTTDRDDIMRRDKAYYAALAQACSGLLSQTNQVGSVQSLTGDDKSLPKILLELHATTIKIDKDRLVGTNNSPYVGIIFGEGRNAYVVAWQQSDYDEGDRPWGLSIEGDFATTVLFTTTNAPWIQGSPAKPFAKP